MAIVSAVGVLLVRFKFADRKKGAQSSGHDPGKSGLYGRIRRFVDMYLSGCELLRVRRRIWQPLPLSYQITMKDTAQQKAFLDELRCRNGNLNILCGRLTTERDEL